MNKNADRAWKMNQVISAMNNEEAYYDSGWLYTWVDGSDFQDAVEYFSDDESFKELEDLYLEVFKDYYEDGWYNLNKVESNVKDFILETAKKLEIKGELEETQPGLWEFVDKNEEETGSFVVEYGDDPRDLMQSKKFGSKQKADRHADNLRDAYSIVNVVSESLNFKEDREEEVSLFDIELEDGARFKIHQDVFYCDIEQEGVFEDDPEFVNEFIEAGFILKGTELYIPAGSVLTFEGDAVETQYSLNDFVFPVAEWADDAPMKITFLESAEENKESKTTSRKDITESLKAYDPKAWSEEDIEFHKSIDWSLRNFEEFPVKEDTIKAVAILYDFKNIKRVPTTFVKTFRANPIYSPYYAPVDNPFENATGGMYDGEKHGIYSVHNRFETWEMYDAMFESVETDSSTVKYEFSQSANNFLPELDRLCAQYNVEVESKNKDGIVVKGSSENIARVAKEICQEINYDELNEQLKTKKLKEETETSSSAKTSLSKKQNNMQKT